MSPFASGSSRLAPSNGPLRGATCSTNRCGRCGCFSCKRTAIQSTRGFAGGGQLGRFRSRCRRPRRVWASSCPKPPGRLESPRFECRPMRGDRSKSQPTARSADREVPFAQHQQLHRRSRLARAIADKAKAERDRTFFARERNFDQTAAERVAGRRFPRKRKRSAFQRFAVAGPRASI